jgi:hypothetical protein
MNLSLGVTPNIGGYLRIFKEEAQTTDARASESDDGRERSLPPSD